MVVSVASHGLQQAAPQAIAQAPRAFKAAIVAPVHIQPSENWIRALQAQAQYATIIIVDDSDGKVTLPENWEVYGYEKQRAELGDDLYAQFEQFHKSSACKNFGTWLAHKRGFDPIIVIDSDCIIPLDFVAKHIENLFMKPGNGWTNSIEGTGWYARGYPFNLRATEKWAHMGLWEHELDLYGFDRFYSNTPPPDKPASTALTTAQFFPLSGMNVSFRRDAIPYMLFLPNYLYNGKVFTRHDDIWGGYIFQKFCQTFNKGLSFGEPVVYHDTVVDAAADAASEEPMIFHEADYYGQVDEVFALDDPQSYEQFEMGANYSLLDPLRSAFKFWFNACKSNE